MPPLFSGNGRHRRPRQAPSFVVTAGATGAGLAIPLLGAGAASAADTETWDRVAECESGGLWSADEDNGFYGGLQLDQEIWEEYGGTEHAERPDLASRGQQIDVAERILRAEGTGTWSDCAEDAGLSQDATETPDTGTDGTDTESDVAVPERPYPTSPETAPEDEGGADGTDESSGADGSDGSDGSADPSQSPDPSDSEDSEDSYDRTPGPDGSESGDRLSEPSAPADGGSDGGSGEGSRDGSSGEAGGDRDEYPDGHASREGADRGEAGPDGEGHEGHRVSPGESLYEIADEYDVRGGWSELYERNRDVVGSDPDLIVPGQELRL